MITFTDTAQNKILDILADEGDPTLCLRMFVQGGGCSGFQYAFTLDSEKTEDDIEISLGLTTVLVDNMSIQYLDGSIVDYIEDLMNSQFKIVNPQASSTCGCGSSFSV